MGASGSAIAVSDDLISAFSDLKLRNKYRYIIAKISPDCKWLELEKSGAPDETYEMFLSNLPEDEPRFSVVWVPYALKSGAHQACVFLFWAPENSRVKEKMKYYNVKDIVGAKLRGVDISIKATDSDEVDFDAVLDLLNRK